MAASRQDRRALKPSAAAAPYLSRAWSARRRVALPGASGEGREHLRLEANPRQRQANLLDFPGQVGAARPVLQGAAAAVAEVRTGRRYALRARLEDLQHLRPISVGARTHPLARQGEGHEEPAGEAVALCADGFDSQFDRV